MRILSVVGEPSYLSQLAVLAHEFDQAGDVEHVIVHAGRYDDPCLKADAVGLELPPVHRHLEVGDASLGMQTALTLLRLEPVLRELQPELVIAFGDDPAAAAAAIATATLGIRLGHVEAGLRFDEPAGGNTMPEAVADRLADILFVPSRDAVAALKAEGVAEERIQFVGSLRVDALCWSLARRQPSEPSGCIVAQVHDAQPEVVAALAELGRKVPVAPAPAGYRERMDLVAGAALVITDADDLQEETSYLGIPCITLRSGTDHPTTCQHGTNRLVAAGRDTLLAAANRALSRRPPARPVIERWDGRAAERIVRVLCEGLDLSAEERPRGGGRRATAMPQMA